MCEPSEPPDGNCGPTAAQHLCLASQLVEGALARSAIALDAGEGQEMRQFPELLTAEVEMELERCRVGVDSHDRHLACGVVDVEAIREESRLLCVQKLDEPLNAGLELV
jgi:hypothetical protein